MIKRIYYFCITNRLLSTYKARTPLRLGVSRCSTLLWHSYDMCRTGVLNNYFFFTSTHIRSVSDTYITIIRAVLDNLDKHLKQFFFLLLPHTINTRVTYVLRNVDQLGVIDIIVFFFQQIDIIVDYIIFSFFHSKWINKGQILWYLVELFLMKKIAQLDYIIFNFKFKPSLNELTYM